MSKTDKIFVGFVVVVLLFLVSIIAYDSTKQYPVVEGTVVGVSQPTFFNPVETYAVCDEGHQTIFKGKMRIVGTRIKFICKSHKPK